jgi:hypothetical protein
VSRTPDSNEIWNFYVALRPLLERAETLTPADYMRLLTDIGALISDVRRSFEGDSEALSALDTAEIHVSLGDPEQALVQVRAVLIQWQG